MSEIEVGNYIRTKNGVIGKVELIREDCVNVTKEYMRGSYLTKTIWKDEIKKHSKNIINLLEYGDIIDIFVGDSHIETIVIFGDELNAIKTGDLIEEDIKSVVTRQMFNSIKYEVE